MCPMPPAAPLAAGRAPPWSLSLVTLSCTASTRGFSCVAFILTCQYVRLYRPRGRTLTLSQPFTPKISGGFRESPDLGQRGIRSWCWRVWRTCVAHAPHSSMLTHFLSTFTSHLETTLRGTSTYMANAVAESGMGKRMLSVRKLVGYDSTHCAKAQAWLPPRKIQRNRHRNKRGQALPLVGWRVTARALSVWRHAPPGSWGCRRGGDASATGTESGRPAGAARGIPSGRLRTRLRTSTPWSPGAPSLALPVKFLTNRHSTS